ncbi:MAG: EamA family transporter [Nitrospinota bacterium]
MSPLALVLVLSAAVFHVGWNYLTKSTRHKAAFLWLMHAVFAVAYLPVFLFMGYGPGLSWKGWAYVVGSGAVHAVYYWTLARSYEAGDLSLVYPVARGTSVILVAVFSALFLTERPSGLGAAGIATVLGGIYTLHLRTLSWKDALRPFLPARTPGSSWALVTGARVAVYSLMDKAGVGLIEPGAYAYLLFLTAMAFFTPIVFRGGAGPVVATWRAEARRVVVVGLSIPVAYLFILVAYTLAPVAYVVASREVRLALGAVLGALLLGEGRVGYRLAGSVLILLGVGLLALAQ